MKTGKDNTKISSTPNQLIADSIFLAFDLYVNQTEKGGDADKAKEVCDALTVYLSEQEFGIVVVAGKLSFIPICKKSRKNFIQRWFNF